MTDRTQPEAGSIHIIRYALEMGLLWVDGDGRDKVREALDALDALEAQLASIGAGGVQALSAAPAVHASVKGAMWFTKKPVTIQAIQWAGDNLREVITFTDGPPDTRSHHAGMAWDDYRDLVERDGLKIYTLEGKMLASPGDWIIRGVKGELYPCKPDIFQETYATASPTPPAEQQAAPKASPGVGNTGFDHQTAADFLSGKTVSDESVRKFVQASRWAHDEKASLSAMLLSVRGVLSYREAEIALLKKALMDAEAAPQQEAQEPMAHDEDLLERLYWEFDAQRKKTGEERLTFKRKMRFYASEFRRLSMGKIAFTYSVSDEMMNLADRLGSESDDVDPRAWKHLLVYAPQPAPAPPSDDAKDAARYRWLRENWFTMSSNYQRCITFRVGEPRWSDITEAELDAAIDAALAAQGGK